MIPARMQRSSFSRRIAVIALASIGLVVSGCSFSTGIPGAPDVKVELPDSAAQQACRQYARAFIDGTDRATITAGVTAAQATAASDSGDADAQRIASAIDQFLTTTVVGTRESLDAANAAVFSACGDVGVNISFE
jgi:hypothetical protein